MEYDFKKKKVLWGQQNLFLIQKNWLCKKVKYWLNQLWNLTDKPKEGFQEYNVIHQYIDWNFALQMPFQLPEEVSIYCRVDVRFIVPLRLFWKSLSSFLRWTERSPLATSIRSQPWIPQSPCSRGIPLVTLFVFKREIRFQTDSSSLKTVGLQDKIKLHLLIFAH